MWGEIDPPVKTQPNLCESKDEPELPEENGVTFSQICGFHRPADTRQPQQQQQDTEPVSQAESTCVNDMVEAIARSGSSVKSQQKGDAELTLDQRREELLQHSDPRVLHYGKVIERRAAAFTNRTRVRNQRYAALRALQEGGEYFSDEQMRIREPLLYEQYIGQYLTDEEVLARSQESMLDDAQGGPGAPAGNKGGLTQLLLNSYQERLIQDLIPAQQKDWEPTAEEKALLREEFIGQMHQRFLDGKDKDINYSEVDENPDYDNLDIVSRDEEDKYFDDEDDDEEEEMENDEEDENMTE
ncbi:Coiled-coil domain containing protein 97 [Dissostichus eleginoides]|uniref:Coiled-coil domain containing protein 97 n=1 Tax=Dissostichus eleginoides TaxID=100907 RepID=A0AAD9B458_DISEL|nr:Coiled-coil domain containing protein 97 [Dissostichus eleginoides]